MRGWGEVLVGLFCVMACQAWAGQSSWKLPTREEVTLPVQVSEPSRAPVRQILVALEGGDAWGKVDLSPATPVWRNRERLAARGVVVLMPGASSDQPKGVKPSWRGGSKQREDLLVLMAAAQARYPDVPLFVEAYRRGVDALLNLAENRVAGVAGYVIISGSLAAHRDDPLADLGIRGLVVQPVSAHCADTPSPEARNVATAAHWSWVTVGDEQADRLPDCSSRSRVGLAGHDGELVRLLQDWMSGQLPPSHLGADPAALAYSDQVFLVPGESHWLGGHARIELTLLTPPGRGPFPLVLYSHGDIRESSDYIERHKRYRDMKVADEFLALGYAVAFPARPGIGHSDGNYTRYEGASGFYIGPATGLLAKGREQMAEALFALEFLRTRPEVDAHRVLVVGQSAGGFAASCLAAQTPVPEWLRGVVNFSGGRNDGSRGGHNVGMISAFAYLGKSSQIPQLWIFATDDSHYSEQTIQDSYAAFMAAGGMAELHIYPRPGKKDGHFIYHQPRAWRQDLRVFMRAHALLPDRRDDLKGEAR